MAASLEEARRARRERLLRCSEERLKRIVQGDRGYDKTAETAEQFEDLPSPTPSDEGSDTIPPSSEGRSTEGDPGCRLRHNAERNSSSSDGSQQVSKERSPDSGSGNTENHTSGPQRTVKTNDAFAERMFPGITTGSSSMNNPQRGAGATFTSSFSSSNAAPTLSTINTTTTTTTTGHGGARYSAATASRVTLSLLHFDLARLISCMLLAFLTRKILNSSWSLLFAESIIVPFTLLQFGFYTFLPRFCKAVVLPKRGSLIDSGLTLCGVDRTIIDTYQRFVAYSTSIAEDFAIYMFTFFLVDGVIG
ncbi:uncharacterized protein LOC115223943 [Argonauta hians]